MIGLAALVVFVQFCRIGSDLWLIQWINRTVPSLSTMSYIGIYFAFGIAQTVANYCFAVFFAFSSTRAASQLHSRALDSIVHASVRFYDTTPHW